MKLRRASAAALGQLTCTLMLSIVLAMSMPAIGSPAAEPASSRFDPSRVTWSELEFKLHALIVSAEFQIGVETVSRQQAEPSWISPSQGTAVLPTGPEVVVVTEVFEILGRRFDTTLWFDPGSLSALQRISIETKKNVHRKIFRFTEEGYYLEWRKPEGKEEKSLPPARWSQETKSYETHPSTYRSGTPITGSSAVFYLLSASDLEAVGDTMQLLAFSQQSVSILTFKVEGMESLNLEYEEHVGGTQTKRTTAEALRISVDAKPLDPSAESSHSHMGMMGNGDYFIDRKTRVPVEMRGKMPVGSAKLKLKRVVTKPTE